LFANGGGWDANAQRIENDGIAAETWSWVLVGVGVATVASSIIVSLVELFGGPHDGPKLALIPLRDGAFVSGAFAW
ncbi:MAG: hypothetical protein ACO1OB_29180, partial [Archangium sp.]